MKVDHKTDNSLNLLTSILQFFKNLTLRNRISMLFVFLFLLTTAQQIYQSRVFFIEDKKAYLWESQSLKTAAIAQALSLALREKANSLQASKTLGSAISSRLKGAERDPERNEVFLEAIAGMTKWLVTRRENGEITALPFDIVPTLNSIFLISETRGLVATQAGQLQAYFGMSRSDAQFAMKSRFKDAVKFYVSQGQSLKNAAFGQDWLVTFSAVPNTNLIVYSEVSLSQLMKPVSTLLKTQAGSSLLILIGLLFFVHLLFNALTRPISSLVRMFEKIEAGVHGTAWPTLLPEFFPIVAAVNKMESTIFERQAQIEKINAALEDILTLSEASHSNSERLNVEDIGQIMPGVQKFIVTHFGKVSNRCFLLLLRQKNSTTSKVTVWFSKGDNYFITLGPQNSGQIFSEIKNLLGNENNFLEIDNDKIQFFQEIFPKDTKKINLASLGNLELETEFICAFSGYDPKKSALEEKIWRILFSSLEKTIEEIRLKRISLEKAHTDAEIGLARGIQRASLLLPGTILPHSLLVDSYYEPSEQVGGDWFGVSYIETLGVINVYMGDVSGHGLSSAFLGSLVSGAIQMEETSLATEHFDQSSSFDPGRYFSYLLEKLNSILLNSSEYKKTMTLCMASLEVKSGSLTVLSAGHPPPIVSRAGVDKPFPLICSPSTLLGFLDVLETNPKTFQLERGDTVLFYTDGFADAKNQWGKTVGQTAFRKLMNSVVQQEVESAFKESRAPKTAQSIGKAFASIGIPDDDLALVSLRWT